ncbi:MAG TPA: hypothetical protein VK821_00040 [Dehalococcoidia bacterium]|nr:hypothetical protein [Dehalococcoidia bacterium]
MELAVAPCQFAVEVQDLSARFLQLTGPLLHLPFQRFVLIQELKVQCAGVEQISDAEEHLNRIDRLERF